MTIKFSPLFIKELKRIKEQNKAASEKIRIKLLLFQDNPKHPSLRIHKLSGNMNNVWSLSVSQNIRIIYRLLDENIAYFIDIGTHDEVYRK